ncbi:DUF3343 domain-containing protein [Alkaliphilus crotonatoxidans]
MSDSRFYVMVFESTHFALTAEKELNKMGYSFTIMPTPREITASCGLSIGFDEKLLTEVKGLAAEGKINTKGIFELIRHNGVREARPVD